MSLLPVALALVLLPLPMPNQGSIFSIPPLEVSTSDCNLPSPPSGGAGPACDLVPVWTQESLLRLVPEETYPAAKAEESAGQPVSPAVQPPIKPHPHHLELSTANWHPMTRSEKFAIFYRDLYSWDTHISLAIDAGLAFATKDREFLGSGAAGYFSRYGMNVADEANFTFFQASLFPILFHEDPRYIPLDRGPIRERLVYSLSRVLITRNDAGHSELNKSKILGTAVSTSLSCAYYASLGGTFEVGTNFANIGINLASDSAFNVFKEFWPDVARKLKINVWVRNLVRSTIRDGVFD